MYFKNSAGLYGKPVKVIHAGEWHVSNRDEMILTILGSCVAVCIHDPVNRVSGMNHFMLPGHTSASDISSGRTARYCITAMKILMENLTRLGAGTHRMRASIFGGGTMTGPHAGCLFGNSPLSGQNVRIAKLFLEMEDIPLCQEDTGGSYSRKIIMDVTSGRVYMKRKTDMGDGVNPPFTPSSPRPGGADPPFIFHRGR